VDVVRDRTTLARIVQQGRIENVYRLQVMNATEQAQRYRFGVMGLPGVQLAQATELDVLPAQSRWVTLAVQVPPQAAQELKPGSHPIRFEIAAVGDDTTRVSERSTFLIPR
jgi:polyferredoxin